MRLLHCADVHLDTAFRGLGPEASVQRRVALRQTFQKLVGLAVELKVDALTIAGDLYEDRYAGQDTARFLAEQLGRLPFPVLISPGNHDYWHPGSLYAVQEWPANVHVFSTGEFAPFELEGFRIFGIAHTKPKGTSDLLEGFTVPEGQPAVALFHGSERGQLPVQGEGKEDHAPFGEPEIAQAGFRFGLVGHFHTPRVTARMVYPGNPEPLTFGELGERGAAEVDFSSEPPVVKIHPVGTFTLSEVEVDVTGCQHSEAVVERAKEALPVGPNTGARVRVVGELALGVRIGPSQLVERLREGGRCVEVVFATRPEVDLEELSHSPDIRGEFVRGLMARSDLDTELVQSALRAGLEALRGEEPAIL
jgi:DNA repair exonuclease SbcCD nuclease subunit